MTGPSRDLEDLGLRSPKRMSEELRAEMEAHIQHRVDDLIGEGVPKVEARAQAEAEFGDAARIARDVDRVRRKGGRPRLATRIDELRQDLRFAFRQAVREPAFAAIAVLTLALGIGATVTIASVVRTVVLDPLPFDDPGALAELHMVTPAGDAFSVSEPTFLEWRETLDRFEDVGAIAGRGAILRAPGEPTTIERGYLNAGMMALLGMDLVLGREFRSDEDEAWNGAPVALVSEAFWTTRFARSADVLGQTLQLDDRTFDIIGVVPSEFEILSGDVPVFTPLSASPQMDRGEHYLMVISRRATGVTEEDARAELLSVAAWQSDNFAEDRDWSAELIPLDVVLIGPSVTRAGWVLLAAALLLLTMACLNVSSLMLARASVRRGEMGVRAALGAGRIRLARQLFTESGVMALVGGGLGLAAAALILPVVRALGGGRIPRIEQAAIDPTTVLIALGTVLVATVAFGSAPILSGRRGRVDMERSRGATSGGVAVRRMLVVAQIAASLVLLVGTGLLFRSFVALSSIDPGFDAEGTLAVSLSMPDGTWSWEERGPLVSAILHEIEGVPGVESAGATAVDPFSGTALANFVAREDEMPDQAADFTPIQWRTVTPGFFEAMEMTLLAGRGFVDADEQEELSPIVIDERLATELYGTPAAAMGQRLVWGDPEGSRMVVVGVSEVMRDVVLANESERMVYRLYAHIPWARMTVVARVRDGANAGQGIRDAIRRAAPGLPVADIQSLEANMSQALAEPRFNLMLLGAFAFAGLALAVVGLYGLTAFEVRQRFREMGIRMSLGARPEGIQRMILRERIVLTATGAGVGLVAALLLSRVMESLLFGVTRMDPTTWIGAVAILGVTTVIAAWIPARRATRVDVSSILNTD